jgi:hypothetical protein
MGGACSTHGSLRNAYKISKVRDHSEDISLDGKIILEWKIRWEGREWIHLAQDSEQWRTVVNTVMKFRVQ